MNAETVLIGALAFNAVLGFGYRVYRLAQGGPMSDVIGQAVLGVVLAAVAVAVALGAEWARWAAFGYALAFAMVVMPVWTLAVLIPMRPRALDYSFAGAYWVLLLVIGITAVTG